MAETGQELETGAERFGTEVGEEAAETRAGLNARAEAAREN